MYIFRNFELFAECEPWLLVDDYGKNQDAINLVSIEIGII